MKTLKQFFLNIIYISIAISLSLCIVNTIISNRKPLNTIVVR